MSVPVTTANPQSPTVRTRLSAFLRSEFVRYVLAGGVSTVVTYGAYLLLLPLMNYQVAYGLTYVAGIFLGYWLNAHFVFRQPLQWRKAIQFPIVYVVQYGLTVFFLFLMVEVLQLSEQIAPAFAITPTVPFTFLLTRYLLKPKQQPPPSAGE